MFGPAGIRARNTASDVKELYRIAQLRDALRGARREGRRVALVPTMGALHEGHLRLVDVARELAGEVVMSVFVNPRQFGEGEDFERYPRDPDADRRVAVQRGVDVLFAPTVEEMYPAPPSVEVVPGPLGARWEGALRPGHFTGVLTVVAKLFNIVEPDVAVFGQKDIQQATLVRAMVRDLNLPIAIEIGPTVREPDGLAMSSRNRYLSPEERRRALSLVRALQTVSNRWSEGERDSGRLATIGGTVLEEGEVLVDYLALVHPDTFEPVQEATDGTIVAVAGRVGATRLIDNIILGRA